MTSKPVFRHHCQDEDREHILSVTSRETSIVISTLRTFSCESDMEPIDGFDSQSCFAIDNENSSIYTRSQDKSKKDPKQQHGCFLQASIVTPPQPSTTMLEIPLDQKSPLEKESGITFPSADPGCQVATNPEYETPLLSESGPKSHPCDGLSNLNFIAGNLRETFVYKQLRPSLPLPGSVGPILCLLLHMELSSMIDGTIMTQACEIVAEQWKEDGNGIRSTDKSGRKVQNIAGRIVDKLVHNLGPQVDLPVLFQVSAQIYNNFAAARDDRLSIFFRQEVDLSETLETESQVLDDMASCATNVETDFGRISGKKRKERESGQDENEEISSKNRTEFVPTVLQLAIAYGVNYPTNENSDFESGRMSLEKFVEKKSRQLQCMGPIERSNAWNHLIKIWHDRGGTS